MPKLRYVYMLGPNLVDWRSRKQALVTTSTTETELVAMGEATEDLEWKLGLLKELTNEAGPATLLSNCQSRIKKLRRGEAGGSTKYLDIHAKAVADRMERSLVSHFYLLTDDNVADMLKKRLGFSKVQHLCALMGLTLVVNKQPISHQPMAVDQVEESIAVMTGPTGCVMRVRMSDDVSHR